MLDVLLPLYLWIKALHVVAVIAWMAGLFYLPRLFVYHAEAAGSEPVLRRTFVVMERKLMKLIMTPAMVLTWAAGLILIAMGMFDWAAGWAWVKLAAVLGMTGMHGWLELRRKEFAAERNSRSGRTYRLANEVPTVLMLVIVVMVIVRPF